VIDLDVPRRVIRVVLTVYRSFLVCPDKQIPQSPSERLEGGKGEVIPTRGAAKRRWCDTSKVARLNHIPA
jgi:hypothetical protein